MVKYPILIPSLAFLSALLSGCTTSLVYDYGPEEARGLLAKVLDDESSPLEAAPVLALNEEIRAALDQQIRDHWSNARKLAALREFLFSENRLGIHYDPHATRTAIETFEARSGNCLSLTNLFIASARYVDLDANYRTIEVPPTWNKSSGTVVRYEHIVATGRLRPNQTYVLDFLPEFVIGDRPNQRVSDATALSLYYNNLGAEQLLAGNAEQALRYLRQALDLRPEFSDAWNNMGAVMNRLDKPDLAEFSYHKSLFEDPTNYSALSNLAAFYRSRSEEVKAEEFMKRVNRYRRHNPYFHYFVAELLYEEGRLEDAKALLERSIELKQDEPDFYSALATLHDKLGEEQQSQKMRERAQRYRQQSFEIPDRQMSHRFWTYR